MRLKPIIYGCCTFIITGLCYLYAYYVENTILPEHPGILELQNGKVQFTAASEACLMDYWIDITDETIKANNTLINNSYGQCQSIDANYVVATEVCANSIFSPGYCGACTSVAQTVEQFVGTDWSSETSSNFKFPSSNAADHGTTYVNNTMPSTYFLDAAAFGAGNSSAVIVVPLLPTEPTVGLYPVFAEQLPSTYIERNESARTCYSNAVGLQMATAIENKGTGLWYTEANTYETSDCLAAVEGDYRITTICHAPSTDKIRIMGAFAHFPAATPDPYTLYMGPITLPVNDFAGDPAQWMWMDPNVELTNQEITAGLIKKMDDRIYAAGFGPIGGLKGLGNLFIYLGVISIIGGLFCKKKPAEGEDDDDF